MLPPEGNVTLYVNYTSIKNNLKGASLGCEEPGMCVISDRAKERLQDYQSVNAREPGSQSSTRTLFQGLRRGPGSVQIS